MSVGAICFWFGCVLLVLSTVWLANTDVDSASAGVIFGVVILYLAGSAFAAIGIVGFFVRTGAEALLERQKRRKP